MNFLMKRKADGSYKGIQLQQFIMYITYKNANNAVIPGSYFGQIFLFYLKWQLRKKTSKKSTKR